MSLVNFCSPVCCFPVGKVILEGISLLSPSTFVCGLSAHQFANISWACWYCHIHIKFQALSPCCAEECTCLSAITLLSFKGKSAGWIITVHRVQPPLHSPSLLPRHPQTSFEHPHAFTFTELHNSSGRVYSHKPLPVQNALWRNPPKSCLHTYQQFPLKVLKKKIINLHKKNIVNQGIKDALPEWHSIPCPFHPLPTTAICVTSLTQPTAKIPPYMTELLFLGAKYSDNI